jgi:hydroxymethylglutaryl-CoA reductase (NADPH)
MMISIPSFLLKRLYVKGSLRNNPDGFQFEIENKLGSGYGNELKPLTLDGQVIPLKDSSFLRDSSETLFSEVNRDRPFTLPMNKRLTVKVKGITIAGGPHKIGMSFVTEGLGQLGFEVTDVVGSN